PRLGGIELHVRDLAERQRASGHEVSIATRTPGVDREDLPGVLRVERRGTSWLAEQRPDVVHAHVSIVSPFALTAARRAARAGIPTVVTVHSLWTHVGPLPELARDLWGMQRWPVAWSAVSEPAAQLVRDLLGVPVGVVPNAVDLSDWSPPTRLPYAQPPHVLSVMRLTTVKRAVPLALLLARAAQEVDLTATIVGNGPQRRAVEHQLRRHRLTDRVRLTGTLDRSSIRRELAGASVFLAPAHRESFGIAALEARASGVPIIASARSGVATFVEHGRDGLLGADDHELADHVITMLQDRDLRERIAWHNRLVRPRSRRT
ncbi:MAG TPA: glycosyltransferase family 4 protein, partial [Nocardioides sp.]|nr:glycosyltransferase family 4 protein [Nocardioides sp.]